MSLKNRIIGLAAVGAAALTLAPGAFAKTAATTTATASFASACDAPASAVFAPWGDNALYQLVDGGTFEAGAPGWSLTGGATVVRDLNDGIASDGAADEYALELGPTAVAISPPICVTKDSSQFAFCRTSWAGSARSRT